MIKTRFAIQEIIGIEGSRFTDQDGHWDGDMTFTIRAKAIIPQASTKLVYIELALAMGGDVMEELIKKGQAKYNEVNDNG